MADFQQTELIRLHSKVCADPVCCAAHATAVTCTHPWTTVSQTHCSWLSHLCAEFAACVSYQCNSFSSFKAAGAEPTNYIVPHKHARPLNTLLVAVTCCVPVYTLLHKKYLLNPLLHLAVPQPRDLW